MHKLVKGLVIAFCLFGAHCVAAGSMLTVHTKDPTPLNNPGDLTSIFKRGGFQVAMVANLPPFTHILKNQEPSGIDVELVRKMAKTMGVRANIYLVHNPNQLLSWVEKGLVDFALSNIPMTVASTQDVYFAKPYLTANYAMLVNRYRGEKLRLNDTLGSYDKKTCRLGYVAAGYTIPVLKYPFFKATKIKFSNYPDALVALKNNKIDALFGDSITLKYYYNKDAMNAFNEHLIILPGFYMFSAIAQRFLSLMLGGWISYFIESMYIDKASLLSYVNNRYKVEYHRRPGSGGVVDEEI